MSHELVKEQTLYHDEISLQELFHGLWSQKKLIAIITTLCITIAGIYLALAKPVYEAKAYIVPPTLSDIAPLNKGRSSQKNSLLLAITLKDVYKPFASTLLSEGLKQRFFNEIYLPSHYSGKLNLEHKQSLYKIYSKSLTIKDDTKPGIKIGNLPQYLLIARAGSEAKALALVKEYVAMANEIAEDKIKKNMNVEQQSLAKYIKLQLDDLKSNAKQARLDRVMQLKEALVIAEATGLVQHTQSHSVATDTIPMMYMRGSKALRAEIQMLNTRKDDASFSSNIRNLESKYHWLQSLSVDMSKVSLFGFDGDIQHSDSPISPKVGLIFMLGLLGGLMLGGGVALIRMSLRRESF